MLFFDADEPYRGAPKGWVVRIYPTRNGFHAIGVNVVDAYLKWEWWNDWKEIYPDSDYFLANLNWLAPACEEELEFIEWLSAVELPIMSKYYRDKRVFETFDR